MDTINPAFDAEAQRADTSEARRSGTYFFKSWTRFYIYPRTKDNYGDPSGKLWSMYLAEAEKEDKELTEAWKGEADSILVFVSENALTSSTSDN